MSHVRVLEAFQDGEELVVRSSKNYDIGSRNLDTLLLLSRWWLGHPNDKLDIRGYVPTDKVLTWVQEQNSQALKSRRKSKPKTKSKSRST